MDRGLRSLSTFSGICFRAQGDPAFDPIARGHKAEVKGKILLKSER